MYATLAFDTCRYRVLPLCRSASAEVSAHPHRAGIVSAIIPSQSAPVRTFQLVDARTANTGRQVDNKQKPEKPTIRPDKTGLLDRGLSEILLVNSPNITATNSNHTMAHSIVITSSNRIASHPLDRRLCHRVTGIPDRSTMNPPSSLIHPMSVTTNDGTLRGLNQRSVRRIPMPSARRFVNSGMPKHKGSNSGAEQCRTTRHQLGEWRGSCGEYGPAASVQRK
jgi:hypothetical protein